MVSGIETADMTATLQAAMDSAIVARRAWSVPAGGNRLTSTGLGYSSNAIINMVGDLYNDHGPLVGTHYCLTNRTGTRLRNITIVGTRRPARRRPFNRCVWYDRAGDRSGRWL